MTGGLSLPESGQYQAEGFVFEAKQWDAVPIGERDASHTHAQPTAAFESPSPGNLTAAG